MNTNKKNKLWCIQYPRTGTTHLKNECTNDTITIMNVENSMLSERSQTQQNIFQMILFL